MKKETTIIATVELTEISPKVPVIHGTIEEVKEYIKRKFEARIEGLGFDNINITNMQVFELEKEERISTEDLISLAKSCGTLECEFCSDCPYLEDVDCIDSLMIALADRLEELHNQQTEKRKKEAVISVECGTCRFDNCGLDVCLECEHYSHWKRKRG